ncbi:MAG: hypothetical protein Q9226_001643 [Calogaya cf. arnoldii]
MSYNNVSSPSEHTNWKALMKESDKLLGKVIRWIARNATSGVTGRQRGYTYFLKVLQLAPNIRSNETRIPGWIIDRLGTSLDLRKRVGEHNDQKAASERRQNKNIHKERKKRNRHMKMVRVMEGSLKILAAVYEQQPHVSFGDPRVSEAEASAMQISDDEADDLLDDHDHVNNDLLDQLDADLYWGFVSDELSDGSDDEDDSATEQCGSGTVSVRPYTQGFEPLQFGDMLDMGRLDQSEIEAYIDWRVESRRGRHDAGS